MIYAKDFGIVLGMGCRCAGTLILRLGRMWGDVDRLSRRQLSVAMHR